MTRKPIDYSRACIYKICCRDPHITDIYVGSTTELVKRRSLHKHTCNKPDAKHHHLPVYQCIRENGGWANWQVVQIESLSCECGEDLRKREREVFDELRPTLNKNRPLLFDGERQEYNRASANAHYKANKDTAKANAKTRYEKNREERCEQMRAYCAAKAKEKITCGCGSELQKIGLSTHKKTKKHQKWLAENR